MADEAVQKESKPKGSQIRASSKREKMYDLTNNFLQALAKQPLARLSESITGMQGLANSQKMPFTPPSSEEMAMGAMMGSLGRGNPAHIAEVAKMRAMPSRLLKNPNPTSKAAPYKGPPPSLFEIQSSAPGLPPEFNQTRASRTGPIDMNNLPSGTMQYLDPDVAEFMNPVRPDITTRKGQRRTKFMMGK